MPAETQVQTGMPAGMYTLIGAVIAALVAVIVALINSQRSNSKSKKEFIRGYYFDQLKELYLPLYSIVAQSEYIRYRYKFDQKFDVLEIPFLEMKRKVTKTKFEAGAKVSSSVSQHETDVTKQDKKALLDIIFSKKELASQKLLKLAVAYRFDYEFYQDDRMTKEQLEQHQLYELLLIYELVNTIVKETNEKLNICGVPFDENEKEYGLVNYNIFMSPEEFNQLKGEPEQINTQQ